MPTVEGLRPWCRLHRRRIQFGDGFRSPRVDPLPLLARAEEAVHIARLTQSLYQT